VAEKMEVRPRHWIGQANLVKKPSRMTGFGLNWHWVMGLLAFF
jgi:hypothetical protein